MNMKCTCGAAVPLNSRFSICNGCLNPPPGHPDHNPWEWEDEAEICSECNEDIDCCTCDEDEDYDLPVIA